ncbi:protein TolR [Syntrophobacter fumaroxidans]|uniref:Biopolymer transport protein ExbD/TolR n=1 Tax=Syntrophobacter fumaroxidans (strain DSM 10017 / MPOB) TaxID=335543 RepID=A0LG99_SYNFM|nr:protein TolR [Syntrophobacter fumaroxidans]ABK16451.1 Biopolymer transport protein ExbD/TolR [Syntrophobacter fumaroxidans MPOB]HOI94155.1 protein TolR [Syntrophobacter fumaroxidans]
MQANGGESKGMLSEINVTPFVDVMLVLLIIFMVTAPMMTQGIDVKLPESSAPAIPSEDERLMVTVTQDKRIYINDNAVDIASLGTKLAAIYQNRQEHKGVFLRADEQIPYGFVVQVMGTIRQAGIDQIGMVTEPLKGPIKSTQR